MKDCYKNLCFITYKCYALIWLCAKNFCVINFNDSGLPGLFKPTVVIAFLFSLMTLDAQGQTAYSVPAGVTELIVETWGAGGGGGTVASPGRGSGGGGGAYSKQIITVTQSTYYYSVGVGAPAAAGGDSWFSTSSSVSDAIVLAKGGKGGVANGTGGLGGDANSGIGAIKYSGGNGGTTTVSSARSGQGGSSAGTGANGNNGAIDDGVVTAPSGGGNGANGRNSSSAGTAGSVPGGGGSGGFRSSAGAGAGGAGGIGVVAITPVYPMHGSGSRDLFPGGQAGRRAGLMSAAQGFYPSAYQFINLGVQKVYAKAGEKLYLGSSAQGYSQGHIRVYKPSTVARTTPDYATATTTTNVGRIANRGQEVLGPDINGTVAGGYIPFVVDVNETGIWEVHFISPAGASFNDTGVPANGDQGLVSAASWTQGTTATTAVIVAWDVTVASGNTPMPGRVFQNVFNTYSYNGDFGSGFYGKFHVLTEDGYPYLVDNNGMQGIAFTFFVNNRGFTTGTNGTGVRTYKSLNSSTNPNVKNPNDDDDPVGPNQNITHKIFYGKPGTDLPASATYKGGTTWLKTQPPSAPQAVNVTFEGVEGNVGYASSKGGYIKFDSNIGGTYRLTIPGGTIGATTYYPRVLVGPMVAGANTVYWDGKSGLQTDPLTAAGSLPAGSTVSSLKVQVFGAEVHFPFLDVEANANGIIIQQLDKDTYAVLPEADKDVVYWNDKDITRTSDNNTGSGVATDGYDPLIGVGLGTAGVKSSINGHKWGMTGATANGYGNNRALDTYSFVAGPETTEGISVTIRESNLEVTSINSSISTPTAVNVGDNWNYTVVVKNAGPTPIIANSDPLNGPIIKPAKFRLYVPAGITIDPTQVTFTSADVAILGTPTFTPSSGSTTGGIYEAELNMPVNGTAEFRLPVTVTSVVTQTGNGDVNTYATILRPADFTDPDATNQVSLAPTDPFFEATGVNTAFSTAIYTNPAGVVLSATNNIKRHSMPNMKADLKIVKTAKQSAAGNGVGSFTIEVTNLGTSNALGVVVSDVLSSRYTYTGSVASAGTVSYSTPGSAAGTLTWTIGALAINESVTLTFNTTNVGTTNRSNTAAVTADHFDPVLSNNSSTIDPGTTTSPTTDLEIVKKVNGVSSAAVPVGAIVTFQITVKRKSGSNVGNVVVQDILPSGFTFQTATASQGTYTSGTGIWTIGSINDGVDRVLTINAIVKAPTGLSGEYTNVSVIKSTDNLDGDPTNNTSSASITISSLFITNPMIYQRMIK